MKLTKFVHACVLVEDDQHVALFDPDNFTWGSKTFPIDSLSKLDYIFITHTHGDHFSLEFVQALVKKFPEVTIFTTNEVAQNLKENGIMNVFTSSKGNVEVVEAPHENMTPLLGHPNNQNVAITFNNKVTHPGDSFQISKTAPILLLPIDGPWGSTADAAVLIEKVKPKFVLPIHDHMYTDQWRDMSYDWVETACRQHGVTFIRPTSAKAIEVNL